MIKKLKQDRRDREEKMRLAKTREIDRKNEEFEEATIRMEIHDTKRKEEQR